MKALSGYLAAVVGLGFLLTSFGDLTTDPKETVGTISVTGEAVVRVVPDEVIITLGVETFHRELSVAKRKNDERVTDVIRMAQRHGIESKHIQTDYIGIDPRYEDGYFREVIEGYYVRKTVVVTLKDIDQFEPLLTAVTEAGTTNVHGIDFRTSELRKYRDQARALATKAAREKAQAMAGELGASIGAPTSVHENQTGWWSWYGWGWWSYRRDTMSQNVVQNVGDAPPDIEGAFAPGQISVNANVSVSFELKS
jgi:uncharacterized protein YggE